MELKRRPDEHVIRMEAEMFRVMHVRERLDFHSGDRYVPRRVVSIISPSRSGSTVFKYALCLHPDLCHLAGEEEPYYKIAMNGYPWHESDEFHRPNNPEMIRGLISGEIRNHASAHNRQIIQENLVEEPPYVQPIRCRETDTLVLKTPQNCYRQGVLEYLYPEAKIIYIVLLRDKHAVVNGLMDGWKSPDFTARLTPRGWWKFDMPPGWTWESTLLERCIHQWRSAEKYALSHVPLFGGKLTTKSVQISFERFVEAPWFECSKLWEFLGLESINPMSIYKELPRLMATDVGPPDRWKQKRPWLEEVLSDA